MRSRKRASSPMIGRPDIGEDARFRERMGRIRNYEALVQALRPVFAAKPREHWAERLAAHDVPAAGGDSIPQALQEPGGRHPGMFHEVFHPKYGTRAPE